MKNRQLQVLGGIFVLLLLVVLIFENPFRKSEYQKKIEAATALFPNFDKEQVTKIEIIANGQTSTLMKQDDSWVVASMDNYPADTESVDELFAKVGELTMQTLSPTTPKTRLNFK